MHKIKYAATTIFAMLIVVAVSMLPKLLADLHDRSNQGELQQTPIDTIQINLDTEPEALTPADALRLYADETGTPVDVSQASILPAQLQEILVNKLKDYETNSLLCGAAEELQVLSYSTVLYYSEETGQHCIVWEVKLTAQNPSQTLSLTIDDATKTILNIDYSAMVQWADWADWNEATCLVLLEQCAQVYFEDKENSYTLGKASQVQQNDWQITAQYTDSEGHNLAVRITVTPGGFEVKVNK